VAEELIFNLIRRNPQSPSASSVAKSGTLPPDAISVSTQYFLDHLLHSTSLLKHTTLRLHFPEENWYPDTGATHHLTNNLQNLNISSEEYSGQDQIRIGNGTGLSISHSDSASLSFSRRKFLLKQLLHVPNMCKNLLSVRQFALDNDVFFESHSSFFTIKDRKNRLPIHHGQLKDGLYHLLPPQVSSSQSQALVGERTSPHSWHHCLGHPALRTVNFVPSKFQLPVLSNKASVPCPICPQAKGHQLPFSVSKTYICNPLDLIYSDVWGLSPTISINGNRFYVSFVDVFSRFTWFYPI
jgi:hypothetical protein